MFKKQTIIQASVFIIGASIFCRVLGFVREVMIAKIFGTTSDYDIFLIAITIPIAGYSVVRYTMPNVFIPIFTKFRIMLNEKKAWSFFWSFSNLSVILFFLVSFFIFIFSSEILRTIAPGLDIDQIKIASFLLRIGLAVVILGGIETLLRSLLHSYQHFLYPAVVPLLYNIAIILSILLFSKAYGTKAILWGMIFGVFLQVFVLGFVFLRREGKCPYRLKVYDRGIAEAVKVFFFILLVESFGQSYVIIDRFFASSLPEGSVSSLNYANMIFQLPLSIFAIGLGIAIFPFLSEEVTRKNWAKVTEIFSKALKMVIFLTVPIMIFFIFFSRPIVQLFYQRGEFDYHSTLMTSGALIFYSLGLIFFSCYAVILKTYYSLNLVKTLVIVTFFGLGLKFASSYFLVGFFSHKALALTTSLVGFFNFFSLIVILRKKLTNLNIKTLFSNGVKTLFISIISVLIVWIIYVLLDNISVSIKGGEQILKFFLVSFIFFVLFFFLALCFKIEESEKLREVFIKFSQKVV